MNRKEALILISDGWLRASFVRTLRNTGFKTRCNVDARMEFDAAFIDSYFAKSGVGEFIRTERPDARLILVQRERDVTAHPSLAADRFDERLLIPEFQLDRLGEKIIAWLKEPGVAVYH